jgi:hypothetical protein
LLVIRCRIGLCDRRTLRPDDESADEAFLSLFDDVSGAHVGAAELDRRCHDVEPLDRAARDVD